MGKTLAMVIGWVFVVVGILGFFPNPIVGANGLFLTDMNHNIVHLLSGVIFLWVAYKAPMKAGVVMKVFGIVYLLVAVLGFLFTSADGSLLGLMQSNGADNWLHVVLGLGILGAGFMAKGDSQPMAATM